MGSNIIELAKLGHERAAELKASCGAVDVRSLAQLISDLATQLEVQFVRSTNMAVQLANAESKCRELAAENVKQNTHSEALAVDNAALREVVERMVNQFAMSGISPEEKSINPAKSLMFDAKSALFMPATDAFLAEVRAQGVEMLAEQYKAKLSALSTTPEKMFDESHVSLRHMIFTLDSLAAQLRKGVSA